MEPETNLDPVIIFEPVSYLEPAILLEPGDFSKLNILALGKLAYILVISFGSIGTAKKAEEEEKQVEGGRKRPGLRVNIPVTVLQVSAGEEGGPGAFQTS